MNKEKEGKAMRIIYALILMSVGMLATPGAGPGLMHYQGRLTDTQGHPVTGAVTVIFTFWDAAMGGVQLSGFTDTDSVTTDAQGYYETVIGDDPDNLLPPALFEGRDVYLNVAVNGEDLLPRKRLASTAYAFNAATLNGAEGGRRMFVADTEIKAGNPVLLNPAGKVARLASAGESGVVAWTTDTLLGQYYALKWGDDGFTIVYNTQSNGTRAITGRYANDALTFGAAVNNIANGQSIARAAEVPGHQISVSTDEPMIILGTPFDTTVAFGPYLTPFGNMAALGGGRFVTVYGKWVGATYYGAATIVATWNPNNLSFSYGPDVIDNRLAGGNGSAIPLAVSATRVLYDLGYGGLVLANVNGDEITIVDKINNYYSTGARVIDDQFVLMSDGSSSQTLYRIANDVFEPLNFQPGFVATVMVACGPGRYFATNGTLGAFVNIAGNTATGEAPIRMGVQTNDLIGLGTDVVAAIHTDGTASLVHAGDSDVNATLGASNYVGIAEVNAMPGQPVPVTLPGGTTHQVKGLIPGRNYYLGSSSALSERGSARAGFALSTDTLLVQR